MLWPKKIHTTNLITKKNFRGSNKITKDLEVRRDREKPGQPGEKHVSDIVFSHTRYNTNSVKVNR